MHDIPDRDGTRCRFEDLAGRSVEADFGGVRVRVAALEDIVDSKEWANRPKDRDALDELHTMQGSRQGTAQRRPSDDTEHYRHRGPNLGPDL